MSHLLAAISDAADSGTAVNIVVLAARTGQLKGTVSKRVQRLVEAGLVVREPVPGNRKEVRLALTPDGRVVARLDQGIHDEVKDRLQAFLLRYSLDELAVVAKVLGDLFDTV